MNVNSLLIYNPLNKKEILNKSRKKTQSYFGKNCLKIINVGRLTDQKDQLTLLKAINRIKDKISLNLLIVGSGKEKENLLNYIHENKLSKLVQLIDYRNNPFNLINSSDIFILTSLYEGLPNVLLESLVLKKFIISSDCRTGPKEILLNGKGGLLFSVENYKALASRIVYYNENKKKCRLMLLKAYKALHRFDLEVNLEKYLKVVNFK